MKQSTPAMLVRNRLGTLILMKASPEEIAAQRTELAMLNLEPQIRAALDSGVTPGKIAYLAKKLAGAR